ncbi:MAG: hypothetical protein KGJ70_02170, partial [Gemmatimonadota bacterium]|nr:hypothetical protein [Gemmatimonadota bacterium]
MTLPDHPSLDDYRGQISEMAAQGLAAIGDAPDLDALEEARVAYLGDRRGRILEFQRALGAIARDAKPEAGKLFNAVKRQLESALEERRA